MIFNVRIISAIHTVILMVCGSLMIAVGVASANTPDLVSDDHFRAAGVRVFDHNAIGVGCRVFGFCDNANLAQLSGSAITRAVSENKGEPVVADCALNDLVRVVLINRGDSSAVLRGWASARGVAINGSIEQC